MLPLGSLHLLKPPSHLVSFYLLGSAPAPLPISSTKCKPSTLRSQPRYFPHSSLAILVLVPYPVDILSIKVIHGSRCPVAPILFETVTSSFSELLLPLYLNVCGASSPINISILRDLKLSRFLSSCILYCHYRTFNSPLNCKCLKPVLLWKSRAPDTSSLLPSFFRHAFKSFLFIVPGHSYQTPAIMIPDFPPACQ